MNYDQFIERKIKAVQPMGFEAPLPINPKLFEWQKLIVQWGLRQGRCAFFEDCGLGKTPQQLEWARQVHAHTKKPVLILAPLAVAAQTVREGKKFNIKIKHVRELEDAKDHAIIITNYERIDIFESLIPHLAGVVLDESSILKAFTGKLREKLTRVFSATPHRLCCSATPSPNDFTELGQQAEFLGICSTLEMLATYFLNDTANTGTWRLKKHAAKDFWRWVSSWAACVSKPSDLGFSDDGFVLPPLNIEPVYVDVDETCMEDGELLRIPDNSATGIHREMRLSCELRARAAAQYVNGEACIIWCNTNYEADELSKQLPNAIEVRGSDKAEDKEEKLNAFSNGKAKTIITKSSIAGYGLNWQHCSNVIYFPSFSFEDFYQAIRRSYRFGQKKPVNCKVILPRNTSNILKIMKEKMARHETMREATRFTKEQILSSSNGRITEMKTDIKEAHGHQWTLYRGDCVRVTETLPDESIDFSVFSPPFADLFVYSSDVQDMGNCKDLDQFQEQFAFLVKQLYRLTKPGRLCAVHCLDLMSAKWKEGEIELKNFSGLIVDMFRYENWLYHTRITIWKDPVVEMQRTKALGLLHKQLLKDSAMSRVGSPEYILVFRKPGINAEPIAHSREEYPVEQWQKDASPVWMDIRQGRVLNGELAREQSDERHICPLQLDVIERCLRLWSNPEDTVFSPFAGIGSEGVCSLKANRKFIGSELKESYWKLAAGYLKQAEAEKPTLFALT